MEKLSEKTRDQILRHRAAVGEACPDPDTAPVLDQEDKALVSEAGVEDIDPETIEDALAAVAGQSPAVMLLQNGEVLEIAGDGNATVIGKPVDLNTVTTEDDGEPF